MFVLLSIYVVSVVKVQQRYQLSFLGSIFIALKSKAPKEGLNGLVAFMVNG